MDVWVAGADLGFDLSQLPAAALDSCRHPEALRGDVRKRPAVGFVMNLVTDAAGNIYVEEPGPGRVRRIRPDGVIEPFIGTGVEGPDGDGGPALKAKLWFPRGIALDAAGNIYIGDYSQRVRRVDARTGIIVFHSGHIWYDPTHYITGKTCRCPLESIFRLIKPRASYEPFIEPPAQAGVDYSSASRQLPRARVTIYGHVAQYDRGSLPEECSTSAPWRSS